MTTDTRPRCALTYGPWVLLLAFALWPAYWLLTRPAHWRNGVAR